MLSLGFLFCLSTSTRLPSSSSASSASSSMDACSHSCINITLLKLLSASINLSACFLVEVFLFNLKANLSKLIYHFVITAFSVIPAACSYTLDAMFSTCTDVCTTLFFLCFTAASNHFEQVFRGNSFRCSYWSEVLLVLTSDHFFPAPLSW